MAASVVQSNSANTTTTPATVVLGAAPTAGNTLVAVMASDTTHTGVPTAGAGNSYTIQDTQVASQGWYVWTRLVVAGDSATTTFVPNGANPAALMVIEVAGTFDKVGTRVHVTASAAASIAPTGLTPATTDGITLAVGGLHGIVAGALSGGAASAGFTFLRSQFAAGTGGTLGGVIAAYLVTTATSATPTTTLSWTNNATDRDAVQIAFTGLAGGAPAIPPILVMQTGRAY